MQSQRADYIDGLVFESIRTSLEEACTDMAGIYIPFEQHIENTRGQQLHVRVSSSSSSSSPTSGGGAAAQTKTPSLVLFKLHGFSVHNNDPYVKILEDELEAESICTISFDFHGHGYSEGEYLLKDPMHLVEDTLSVIFSKYREMKLTCGFMIFGLSMGGATAVRSGLEIQDILEGEDGKHPLYDRTASPGDESGLTEEVMTAKAIASLFQGCILLCPCISLKLPSLPVRLLLEHAILPWFPSTTVPAMFSPPEFRADQIADEKFHMYLRKNSFPNGFNGMGKGPAIKFQTAFSITNLMKDIQKRLADITFPFLVLHDPLDEVVPVGGTDQLMAQSSTPTSKKTCVLVPHGKHALLPNRTGLVLEHILLWLRAQDLLPRKETDIEVELVELVEA